VTKNFFVFKFSIIVYINKLFTLYNNHLMLIGLLIFHFNLILIFKKLSKQNMSNNKILDIFIM